MEGKGFSCVTLFELPLVGGRLVMCARTKEVRLRKRKTSAERLRLDKKHVVRGGPPTPRDDAWFGNANT